MPCFFNFQYMLKYEIAIFCEIVLTSTYIFTLFLYFRMYATKTIKCIVF